MSALAQTAAYAPAPPVHKPAVQEAAAPAAIEEQVQEAPRPVIRRSVLSAPAELPSGPPSILSEMTGGSTEGIVAPPSPTQAPIGVQRKCSACGAMDDDKVRRKIQRRSEEGAIEQTVRVSPRLEVGAANDHHEIEADAIAAQVMAMRLPANDNNIDLSGASARAPPVVHRRCTACADDDFKIRRFSGADTQGSESLAASESDLMSGGSPLPHHTRSFFESRMGVDLSSVRVHQGGPANRFNASIGARAFTYANHVWLGPREQPAPSFTMAHELAHVTQQTHTTSILARSSYAQNKKTVRRTACETAPEKLFFKEPNSQPDRGHDDAIKWMTTKDPTHLYGEVPIPNANRSGSGSGFSGGRADLAFFDNSRPFGLIYRPRSSANATRRWYQPITNNNVVQNPGTLFSSREGLVRGGRQYSVNATSTWLKNHGAPVFKNSNYGRVADTASQIRIADMKFGGVRSNFSEGQQQVENYQNGIAFAARGYRAVQQQLLDRPNTVNFSGAPTSLPDFPSNTRVGPLRSSHINGVSQGWQQVGGERALEISHFVPSLLPNRDYDADPCPGVPNLRGHLYVALDPGSASGQRGSVFIYAYYPNQAAPRNARSGAPQLQQYETTAQDLYDKIMAPPTNRRGQRRMLAAHTVPSMPKTDRATKKEQVTGLVTPQRMATGVNTRANRSTGPPQRRVMARRRPRQARPIPRVDPFQQNYTNWTQEQRQLSSGFGRFDNTSAFGGAIGPRLLNQAMINTKELTGHTPNSAARPREGAAHRNQMRSLKRLNLMAGTSGQMLGRLRNRFGGVFLRALGAYTNVKIRAQAAFQRFRERGRTATGGKLTRVAKKVGFLLVKTIGDFILPQITDALLRCLEIGFENTINSLIEDGPLADIQTRIQEAQGNLAGLQDDFTQDIDAVINDMVGPFEAELRALVDAVGFIAKLVGLVKLAVNAARLALCVAGGLETAGISCVVAGADWLLGLVGYSPTEALAGYLMDTCFAKEHMAEAMLSMDTVKNLPILLAQGIIRGVKNNLPTQLQGLICNPEDIANEIEMPSAEDIACPDGGSGSSGNGGTNTGPTAGAQGQNQSGGQTDTGTDTPPTHDTPNDSEGGPTTGESQVLREAELENGTNMSAAVTIISGIDPSQQYSNRTAQISFTLYVRAQNHTYSAETRDVTVTRLETTNGHTFAHFYFNSDFTLTSTFEREDGRTQTWSFNPDTGQGSIFRSRIR